VGDPEAGEDDCDGGVSDGGAGVAGGVASPGGLDPGLPGGPAVAGWLAGTPGARDSGENSMSGVADKLPRF
jgi:hypothetical protein